MIRSQKQGAGRNSLGRATDGFEHLNAQALVAVYACIAWLTILLRALMMLT